MEKGKDAFIEKKDPNTKRFPICNYNLGKDLIIFTSDETLDEYKQAERVSKTSENFDLFLHKQRQGLAMPLLEMKFHKRSKFGSSKLFTISKFTPPPPDAQKLFDKGKNKFKLCTIFKNPGEKYDKYTFKFEPNPQNPQKISKHTYSSITKFPYQIYLRLGKLTKGLDGFVPIAIKLCLIHILYVCWLLVSRQWLITWILQIWSWTLKTNF